MTRVDWRLNWSPDEQQRVSDHVGYPELLDAVAEGMPLGVYCVAGPQLVQQVEDARVDEDRPWRYPLVRTVLGWYRTGLGEPIPADAATRLLPAVAAQVMPALEGWTGPAPEEETADALGWATRPVIGGGRTTRQSVLTQDEQAGTLAVHDYLIDHAQQSQSEATPDAVWQAVLAQGTEWYQRFGIGLAASEQDRDDIQHEAWGDPAARPRRLRWEREADAGDTAAMVHLGLLLEDSDPAAARRWFERAADAGHSDAMNNFGLPLAQTDPAAARRWFERAADAAHAGAMNNLGVLLAETDLAAARRWFERAADAGHADAMDCLGVLLAETDLAAARRWWERAAAVGQADASNNLQMLRRRPPRQPGCCPPLVGACPRQPPRGRDAQPQAAARGH